MTFYMPPHIDPRDINIIKGYELFTNEQVAFFYACHWGLLGNDTECELCGNKFELLVDPGVKYNVRLFCRFCNVKRSILHNTVFNRGKIPICKVLLLLYLWASQYPPNSAQIESQLSQPTVTNYYQAFRDACCEYVDFRTTKIGGINLTVQIDETQYVKRKSNQGRIQPNSDLWIFGGICVQTDQIFAKVVSDRTAQTLLPLIQENIDDGTMIASDGWPAYANITNLNNNYGHQVVNHSVNFVDPITGANTQKIERYWRTLKTARKQYGGVPREEVESHVAEAVWRHNCQVDKKNCFYKAIELIRQTHYTTN